MTWLKEQMIRYRVKGTCLLMALITLEKSRGISVHITV